MVKYDDVAHQDSHSPRDVETDHFPEKCKQADRYFVNWRDRRGCERVNQWRFQSDGAFQDFRRQVWKGASQSVKQIST